MGLVQIRRADDPDASPRAASSRSACRPNLLWALFAALAMGASTSAQQNAAVVVDDSPWAWELLRRAEDASRDNPPESARLVQEVLDQYGSKLVPWTRDDPDRFRSARVAANALLLRQPALLQRYRLAESTAAQHMLDAGDLLTTMQSRLLTPAGLEALARIAQSDLEAGRFTAVLSRLGETRKHPDRSELLPHLLLMEAMAAHGAGDPARARTARDGLSALEGETAAACMAALLRFEESEPLPAPRRSVSGLDATPPPSSASVSESWHLIGEQPLDRSLYQRTFAGDDPFRAVPRSMERIQQSGSLLVTLPTIVDELALVNEGHRLRSIDRLSGRPRWERTLGADAVGRDGGAVGDLNVVAVAGDAIVTLSGHAYATERSGPGRVVCLDRDTGEERWSRDLSFIQADDDLAGGLFPIGAPLVLDDAVIVLARRVNSRLESAEYLLSLGLADGRVRWQRHIASSSGVRLGGQRPFSSPVAWGGDVLVSTSVGAIARIDAATGEVRWLVRSEVPIRDPRYDFEPWEMGGPAVLSRGVLAVTPDQSRVVLLDKASGAELEGHPIGVSGPWDRPRYFLVVPEDPERGSPELLAAVGADLTVLNPTDLSRSVWSLSSVRAPSDPEDERHGLRGRVQRSGRTLVVPERREVALYDADSGSLLGSIATQAPGNPCLSGPQLLLATADRLESYMPFAAAERLMRERIAERPDDPERAFALLELGVRAGRLGLCMEAASIALAGIESGQVDPLHDRDRVELYERLLAVDSAGLAQRAEEGEALHAMIGTVAATPPQRVGHLLRYGDWLAGQGRLTDAVETWQRVLDSGELAAAPVVEAGAGMQAFSAVVQRLVDLVSVHGRQVYAPQESFARLRLDQALGNAAAEDLLALTRAFPLASAGVDATLQAASRLEQENRPDRAIAALQAAWRLAEVGAVREDDRRRIAGAMIGTMLGNGWTASAAALLADIERVDGDPLLTIADRTLSTKAWRAELSDGAAGADREARLGDFSGVARDLPGHLLRPIPGGASTVLADRFLIATEAKVVLRGADLETRWTALVDDEDPRLLAFDGERVLLWLHATSVEPVAMMLGASDGAVQWISPRLASVLPPPPLAGGRPADSLTPGGEPFDPGEVLPSLASGALVVTRRNGDAAAIELEDGRTVRWTRPGLLRRVYHAAATDSALVLAGVGAQPSGGDGAREGAVVAVVSMANGQVTARYVPRTGQDIRWLRLAPSGVVVVGTEGGIEGFVPSVDAVPSPLWTTAGSAFRGLTRGWIVDRMVIAADDNEDLVCVDAASGRMRPDAFRLPSVGKLPARLRSLVEDSAGTVLLYEQRAVGFDHHGIITGMDAVSDDRDFRMVVPVEGRLVVVNALGSEQVELPEGLGRRTQFNYAVYQLDRRQGCRLVGSALEIASVGQRFERASAIDGWLLLSTGAITTAVPLPMEP